MAFKTPLWVLRKLLFKLYCVMDGWQYNMWVTCKHTEIKLFSLCSEQSCFGEAREGQCCWELSHSNGSFWKVRRKGKRMTWCLKYVVYFLPHTNSKTNVFSLLSDFRFRLDWDPRKSQSANREKDNCQSKFHLNITFIHHQPLVCLTILLMLCTFQFNRRRVMDSDDEDDD